VAADVACEHGSSANRTVATMLFPTVDFAVFFVLVFTGSWLLRPYGRAWRWFLLGASTVFYLDPANPAHSDGERFLVLNPVLLLATAAVGLLAHQILVLGFPDPPPTGPPVDPDGDADRGGGAATRVRAPAATVPLACVAAPAAVTALVAAAVWWSAQAYPTRGDQNARWFLLLIGVAVVNQAFARAVATTRVAAGRHAPLTRWLVRAAVAVDLAVLGWFKYANWFAEMWTDLASHVGVHLDWLPGIVLPIAISFFMFQAISYVVDAGRGDVEPVSLLDFTVYLTFFAHVVAGPIVRVREFVPQLHDRADPRAVQAAEAFELVFRGLFKKVVVSSYVAAQIVQPVFDAPQGFSRVEVLFAILGYAVQIYADFSGYTDIAIGVALLLGIRFPQNFNAPYRAVSLQDFWHRWHMTLSRWLRDYVYIPLGGNRISPQRTEVNVLATMLLGGLWHGANGTFVVWGAIHGLGQVAEQRIKRRWADRPQGPIGLPRPMVGVLQWLATMTVVCVAWVFFNARDVSSALAVLAQLVVGEGTAGAQSLVTPVLVVVVVASFASQFVPPAWSRGLAEQATAAPPAVQVAGGALAFLLLVVLGPDGIAPFIYFQF
jgi:alginate O-acetyltransferase complex protein AlgI